METFRINLEDERLVGIEVDEDKVWLISDKSIWEWNEERNTRYINFEHENPFIMETFLANGKFLLCRQDNFEIIAISMREADNKYDGVYFSAFNNSIYLLDWKFNVKDKIHLVDKDVDKFKNLSNDKNIVEGSPSFNTMQYFMSMVCSKDKEYFEEEKEENNGKRIHKHIIYN